MYIARDLVVFIESSKLNSKWVCIVRKIVREKQKIYKYIAERLVWKVKIILIHEQRCWRESPWRYIRCPSSSSWVGVDCVTSTAAAPRHPPHTPPASRAAARPSSQREISASTGSARGTGKADTFWSNDEAKSAQQGGEDFEQFSSIEYLIYEETNKKIYTVDTLEERPSWLVDWLIGWCVWEVQRSQTRQLKTREEWVNQELNQTEDGAGRRDILTFRGVVRIQQRKCHSVSL